jgi:hypothetical protein
MARYRAAGVGGNYRVIAILARGFLFVRSELHARVIRVSPLVRDIEEHLA